MIKIRQILAVAIITLVFSGWGGLVLAAGKPCTDDSGCPTGEQCCCCKANQECPGTTADEKGFCFAKQIKSGSQTLDVDCKGVICPFSVHTSVKEFIDEAVSYIFNISIILAPLMIIIGAFLYLTSAGNPKQTKLGGSVIQWTAIGFAIILFAKGISAIIKMILVG